MEIPTSNIIPLKKKFYNIEPRSKKSVDDKQEVGNGFVWGEKMVPQHFGEKQKQFRQKINFKLFSY